VTNFWKWWEKVKIVELEVLELLLEIDIVEFLGRSNNIEWD